jgi:hypothetical protein
MTTFSTSLLPLMAWIVLSVWSKLSESALGDIVREENCFTTHHRQPTRYMGYPNLKQVPRPIVS